MLVHLQIISAESDKITESKFKLFMPGGLRKEKTHFFAVSVCLRFERLVEVAEMNNTLAPGCSRTKKVSRFGRNVVKAF